MAEALVEVDQEAKDAKLRLENSIELPGWGSSDWAGENYLERLNATDEKVKEEKDKFVQRKRQSPIVVNRNLSSKFAKYFVKELPSQFKNEDEYKMNMNTRSGPEWNTSSGMQRKIQPE